MPENGPYDFTDSQCIAKAPGMSFSTKPLKIYSIIVMMSCYFLKF